MDDLSLDTGDSLTKSNLKVNLFLLVIGMFFNALCKDIIVGLLCYRSWALSQVKQWKGMMQLFLRVLPFRIGHQPRLKPCLCHLWPIPFYPMTNEACWRLTLTFFPRQTSQLLFFLKKVQLLVLLRRHLLKSKT